MPHSAEHRSAPHTAEHTRAQEHTGSTAAHSSARPHAHIAHSAAKHGCRLQHNTIAATEHAHTNLLFWVCFPCIPLPFQRTAQHSTAGQTSAQQSFFEGMADQQITQHSCSHWNAHTHTHIAQHSHAAQRTAEKCNTFHNIYRAHQSTVFCPHCPTIFWNPSCTCDVYHGFAAGHLLQRELRIKPDGTAQNKYD